jgi:hypothetical protein
VFDKPSDEYEYIVRLSASTTRIIYAQKEIHQIDFVIFIEKDNDNWAKIIHPVCGICFTRFHSIYEIN